VRAHCAVVLLLTASIALPTCAQVTLGSAPIRPQVEDGPIQNVQPDALWARVKKCFLPDYPQSALANEIAGTVAIGFCVSQHGAVTSYRLLSGHPLLAPPALAAIGQWKFQPAAGAACSRVRALFSFASDGTTSVAFAHAILPDDSETRGFATFRRVRKTRPLFSSLRTSRSAKHCLRQSPESAIGKSRTTSRRIV
jgi:TonB family protein